MRYLALLLLVLWAGPLCAQQAGPPVLVRTTLAPATGAVVGQHVSLFVDVLFPGDMPHPPRVSLPDVPGAQLLRLETQATTIGDRIDGTAYTGQRFEFALYPRRGGPLVVPPADVALLDRAGDPAGNMRGQEVRADITIPPGIPASAPVIATGSLTLQEAWSPDPASSFRAGDAVTRTIVRRAADIPALAMRDLAFTAPAGVRVYAEPPVSDDRVSRGDLTGERTDRATYVFEAGGTFVIPPVSQAWWDLGSHTLKNEVGAGASISVIAVAGAQERPKSAWPSLAWAILAALIAGGSLWAALRYFRRSSALSKEQDTEAAAFRRLLRACASGAAPGAYAAFQEWQRWLPREEREAALPLAAGLEQTLFAAAPGHLWSQGEASSFSRALRAWRNSERRACQSRAPGKLPPLNPR